MSKKLLLLGILAPLLLLGAGCSKDQGVMVTPEDAAKIRERQQAGVDKQIADVENNPNIPAERKQMIIGQIRAGAARAAAGSQSGQAQGAPAKKP